MCTFNILNILEMVILHITTSFTESDIIPCMEENIGRTNHIKPMRGALVCGTGTLVSKWHYIPSNFLQSDIYFSATSNTNSTVHKIELIDIKNTPNISKTLLLKSAYV